MTPEGATLKACMAYLSLCGIAAWRINTMGTPLQGQPGRFRPAPSRGIADIIGIAPARADVNEIRDAIFGASGLLPDDDMMTLRWRPLIEHDFWMNAAARVADVVRCRGPLPLAIEVKSATGRQSPAQVAFARKWEAAGGIYLIARSVPELRAKLRECGVAAK